MWQYNQTQENKLTHAGVLGMKWGIHRGRRVVTGAQSRAAKQVDKLSSKPQNSKNAAKLKKSEKRPIGSS